VSRSQSTDQMLEAKEDLTHGDHYSRVRSVLMWRHLTLARSGRRTRRWRASGQGKTNASDQERVALDALWK
jgi:hypothetical protein